MAKTFCSGIPRMKLQVETCCEMHDKAYSRSGMSRKQADAELYACIAQERPKFAYVVWLGVRLFGWMFYRA